ncbi:hypothetical protein IHN63_03205 [Deinococcus sp. 6YEL10]|uniref:hypothetical protein n=1 Tax=Deinococcus sp. 6YEL10 TaxID=2745870 RepID=UPI001E392809|nr:hypothetical protein [Deinococcus sp. 6YEL10]MCD0160308.1 hypothetical protein [Deinococcus sp. 6YEL10]
MTRPPLELLASIRAAVEGIRTQVQTMGVPETHWGTLDGADDVLLGALIDLESLESALRAQAEAGAGEAELLAELREALVAFDAASAEEDAAMELLMSASQNAPKNERGQYLDPGAVRRAAEPFRPRHRAAQDARMEAQDIIDGLALESARLAVKLAGGLPALAQADAAGGGA